MSTRKITTDIAGFTHIRNLMDDTLDWLASLEAEALARAEEVAPLRGPVRPAQRPWSWALDQIEAQRQRETEADRQLFDTESWA